MVLEHSLDGLAGHGAYLLIDHLAVLALESVAAKLVMNLRESMFDRLMCIPTSSRHLRF